MPPSARKKKTPVALTHNNQPQKTRLWLMYPPKLITTPVVWELGAKFKVVTNVRQASVTDEIGVVCLELEGQRADIKTAIKWLERKGIKVEPVEINVIES
jgi:ABC-type methionine transport system ATPase subunit